jgi:ribosomal protein S18 acetylase RimI-like enzyme
MNFAKILARLLPRQLHPLEQQLTRGVPADVRFRGYHSRDLDACVAIYERLKTGRFPSHVGKDQLIAHLSEQDGITIVAEADGTVVGFGGIIWNGPQIATLCFGMVMPEFQGKGIGTALTLLRLAQLPTLDKSYFVWIFAVESSLSFYQRLGFIESGEWAANAEVRCPVGVAIVPPLVISRLREELGRMGITVTDRVSLTLSERCTCRIENDASGRPQFKWEHRKQ